MQKIVNTHQAVAWNGYEGTHWADNQDRYDAVNTAFNASLLQAAAITESDHVLDIGCGTGQLTRLAARTAVHGRAVGVDLSAPMLARARATAAGEDLTRVEFTQGDAQVHPFQEAGFDVALSRFGVMFFADPVAAFANIARALRPGGRVAFLAMRDLKEHDLGQVFAALAPHLRAHTDDGDGASPVSMADPKVIEAILGEAGFTDITTTRVDAPQVWGKDAADAAEFLLGWGPVHHLLEERDEARAALTEALRPFENPDAVRLRGAAWLACATRP